MQELIEDLRAALDQMNRNLAEIAKNTEETNKLLEKLTKDK